MEFLDKAIEIAIQNVKEKKGGPFGCVIVKEGEIIGMGVNRVVSNNDPTAHAEITAIRNTCKTLNTFDLSGCVLYSSCEPCPMCYSAIRWARIHEIHFERTRHEAADLGFSDKEIYDEIITQNQNMNQLTSNSIHCPFRLWKSTQEKDMY